MKSRFVFFPLFLLLICSTTTHAQWSRQYPMAKLEDVLDIDMHTDGYGFAVGSNDLMLRFNTENKEWDLLPGYGEGWRFESVDYLEGSGGNIAAAGGKGLLLTIDKGETWDSVPGAPTDIHAVKLFSPSHLIAISDEGAFEYENSQWTNLAVPAAVDIKGAFILDEQHMWVYTLATDPAIYYTSNGGNTWQTNTDIEDIDVVRFYDALNGIASDGRKIYNTVNGGANWNLVSTNIIHNTSNDITFGSTPNILMAATLNADPTISKDGGLTWTKFNTGLINQRSFSIASLSDSVYYVGNDLSGIAYTENQGLFWTETSGPDRNLMQDVFFMSRGTGFAIGQKGLLLRTSNGGDFWEDISFGTSSHLSIHGLNVNDIWIGASQRILHSVDTGTTWTVAVNTPGAGINDILALSSTRILAVTSTGVILRSDDSGTTWDSVYITSSPIRSIARIDDQHLMATGFNGILLRSNNSGESWELLTPPEAGLQYEQAIFLNGEGWLVTSSFKKTMWHTADKGTTWTPLTLPIERFWDGVYFITPDTGIVVGRTNAEGRAYITYNGGQTWGAGYITNYPLHGVAGVPNPNGTAWIFGYGSDIEVLPYCNTLPGISDLVGNNFPCEQDTVTFTVNSQNVDSYSWFFPAGWQILGNPNNDTIHVVASSNSGIISVRGDNSCGSSNQINVTAGPSELPSIFNLTGDLIPCAGDVMTYTVISLEVDTFDWTFPSDWQILNNEDQSTIQVVAGSEAGFISIAGSNHCGTDELAFNTDPFTVPEVSVLVNQNMLSLSASALTYQWYRDNVLIPGAENANYTASLNGNYHAELNFAAGCSTVSDTVNVILLATDFPQARSIQVYPVPAYDKLYLTGIDGSFTYSVIDVVGKIVDKGEGSDQFIDVDNLTNGFYILNIQSGEHLFMAKFMCD